ncbi:putative L-ascorbate peroxidase 6 isoform X2 [Diospyros lotus]|uniref:putative L-ascorbate peroxidase 6 isoform X2 n=1 Tax=Diospyros lotus TaxID=55363 RepID=UPI002258FE8C|nr:putative L-ascorbate peroxidase 6 isoform X2 [Diospyros lotus]
MAATGVDTSLLCSTTASFSLSRRNFKFPTKYRARVAFRRKSVTASSSATAAPTAGDSDCALYGRRGILSAAKVSFILYLHKSLEGFRANAAEDSVFVKDVVKKVLSKGKAAGLLRLAFHDAGTFEMDGSSGGMNGSIIYELNRPENTGLNKPLKIIEKAKAEVDIARSVSWADMIAVGGAEAVSLCGGPTIPVQLGRIDSKVPDPEGKLPLETLDVSALKQCFKRKGFSTQELVVLSGAHTLGSKGFGNPTVFDNSYFKILLDKPWLSSAGMSSMIGLPSDRALVEDDDCLRWISKYADNQNLFFEDFKNAYIKLVNTGARWRT